MGAGLAKILDKAFVLGFVLPALLFGIALLAEFGCPAWLHDECSGSSKNPFVDLTYSVLGVYAVAVLLLALNYAIYRILEGYVPPIKWFKACTAYHVRRFRELQSEVERLDDSRGDVLLWELRKHYPRKEEDIRGTSLGNAIRAFEVYPMEMYGADSISVWPRLLTVIPKDVQGLINDAKALVDLCVNLCALSTLLLLALIARISADVYRVRVLHETADLRLVMWAALLSAVVAFVAYRFAVMLVPDWGEQVKSAFDCYLGALAKQLGYELPATRGERTVFWNGFSQMLLYGEPFDAKFATDAPPGAAAKKNGGPGDGSDDEDGNS